VYETDQHDDSNKTKDGVITILPKHKQRSEKNFDNINFKPYEAVPKIPLQMNEVSGDSVVDEYPGGDDFGDDRTPIIQQFA